ncbi:hypothetical protein [Wolbachia endosymbiont of Ctenocephalides felis wCfeT]|uniref:hypothetical protein n=1 Tax=Wolbachia endosymbiont of Ctenocephalides felis wCfeT TaxID=2732593 RepID=UPI00144814AD|nr:hypothetical protein [Wolbachia endosymbiont of Ctenocephalides felis wCfeT]
MIGDLYSKRHKLRCVTILSVPVMLLGFTMAIASYFKGFSFGSWKSPEFEILFYTSMCLALIFGALFIGIEYIGMVGRKESSTSKTNMHTLPIATCIKNGMAVGFEEGSTPEISIRINGEVLEQTRLFQQKNQLSQHS